MGPVRRASPLGLLLPWIRLDASPFPLLREHLEQLQAHPLRGEVLLFQQAFDGFYQIKVFQSIFAAVRVRAGRPEKLFEGLFPVPQGGFSHSGELGDLFDGQH
jgi:hypothetical protein